MVHGECVSIWNDNVKDFLFWFRGVVLHFRVYIINSITHLYFASTTFIQRNGLVHMDVSAKSGAGIDDLIHQLIDIALKQMDENASTNTTTAAKNNNNRNDLHCTTLKRNDELDLHQRYGPKSRSCFPLSFQCCCK